MAKPIVISGDYLVAAGQTDAFVDQQAYLLNTHESFLDIQGTVQITLDQDSGPVIAAIRSKAGAIWNEAGGQFVMKAEGQSTAEGLHGTLASFVNDGSWLVTADAGAGGMTFDHQTSFNNTGLIKVIGSTAEAVDASYGGDFVNSGTVLARAETSGAQAFFFHYVSGAFFSFSNTGHIEAHDLSGFSAETFAIGFSSTEDAVAEFDNSGLIRSNGYAFLEIQQVSPPQASSQVIVNSGKIQGQIDLGLGDDVIHNTGQISGSTHGAVFMGDGNDLYDGSRGHLYGELDGGAGQDTLQGGKDNDNIHGDSGHTDAPGGADVLSGGKGDDVLFGEQGDDIIDGGAGADGLVGGGGSDTYVFDKISDTAVGHEDLINDLTAGDLIDLRRIDADATQAGNQAFVLVGAFDGHAGELVLSYNSVPNQTQVSMDVDGDGTADGVILVFGDHADFTNFVL